MYRYLSTYSTAEILAALARNEYSRIHTASELMVNRDSLRKKIAILKQEGYEIPNDPQYWGQGRPDAEAFTVSPDPTPEELEAARNAIRRSWTPQERARRVVGPKYGLAEIQEIADPLGGMHEVKRYRM
jgi:biotin operon repressor